MRLIPLLGVSFVCLLLGSCSNAEDNSSPVSYKEIEKEAVVYDDPYFKSKVLISESLDYYPMQVFVKSAIVKNAQFIAVNQKVSSYSLVFDFTPVPYVSHISNPRGIFSFNSALREAMSSEEWASHQKEKPVKPHYLAYGIFSSVTKAKNFIGEPALYDVLNDNKSPYVFVAKIILPSFDIRTQTDGAVTEADDACYISSMTFGRYAYLIIQTDEDPDKVMELFKEGILKRGNAYLDTYLQLASSSQTLIRLHERGNNTSSGYSGIDGFRTLMDVFDITKMSKGQSILFELKDVRTKGKLYDSKISLHPLPVNMLSIYT